MAFEFPQLPKPAPKPMLGPNWAPGDSYEKFKQRQATEAAQNPNDTLATEEANAGVPTTSGGQQYMEDMLVNSTNMFPGGKPLPPGVNWGAFLQVASLADQFAAASGWQYFPSQDTIIQMVKDGMAAADQGTVFQYLGNKAGLNAKMPWLASGLTKTQWTDKQQTYGDAIENYTNDRTMFSDLQARALNERWSIQRLEHELKSNPQYAQKTPWLKFGLTYDAFQSFKRENQQRAISQFGAKNLTDANFATLYGEPTAQGNTSGGGAVQMGGQAPASLVSRGATASVR